MSAYTLNIPDDLLREAEQLAKVSNASVNDILLTAIAERIGIDRAQKFFAAFAERADMDAMRRILDRVSDIPPVPGDEI